ncbi:hypothetical protein PCANC_19124 [Puccinia coronata f. sp. avenae]|uniref:Uncharacterized protein n=1 Tax=Puccinia coronata f. sp. avenae TaxID=200324 RepID=A0A2N5SCG9_9BASI|nr:hypothetical protein PCANC_19124 [Puccinia coronata f. sp. avenae]
MAQSASHDQNQQSHDPNEQDPPSSSTPPAQSQPSYLDTQHSNSHFFDNQTLPDPLHSSNSTPSPMSSAAASAGHPPPGRLHASDASIDSHGHQDRTNLPPAVIAIIIVIPLLAALGSVLYWRRKVIRRTQLYAQGISQPDHSHVPGHTRLIIPPGGTGADRPEGQRRGDRMRRLMSGRNRRPSRSDSVRTVPEYSADPQATEMTLARALRGAESNPQPSFLMRFIGNHTATNTRTQQTNNNTELLPTSNPLPPHPPEPPPDYDTSTLAFSNYEPPIQSSSNAVSGPSTSTSASSSSQLLLPTVQVPSLDVSFEPSTDAQDDEETEERPQHHTVHLDRTGTQSSSTSSTVSRPRKSTRRPSLCTLIPPSPQPPAPPEPSNHDLRLPSGGVTPQQLSFLGRIGNLTRLGLARPPDPLPDELSPPPAFDHLAPSSSSSNSMDTR